MSDALFDEAAVRSGTAEYDRGFSAGYWQGKEVGLSESTRGGEVASLREQLGRERNGRFDPDNEALRESLSWHAKITTELQTRMIEAQRYVRRHSGDRKLIAILSGNEGDGSEPPLIECPHWSPGRITLRRGCTACAANTQSTDR